MSGTSEITQKFFRGLPELFILFGNSGYYLELLKVRKQERESLESLDVFSTNKNCRGPKYFDCVDLHCGGEPARVVFGTDLPTLDGVSMAEKRDNFMRCQQHVADLLLKEPRGFPCMNLDVVYPSSMTGIQWGYVIIEQGGVYPMFSGHNTICVVTALLETGRVPMQEPTTQFSLEAPGGEVQVRALCDKGRVQTVSLIPQPAYMALAGVTVDVPSLLRPICVDIAYSGMFYVLVDISSLEGLLSPESQVLPALSPDNGKFYARLGAEIREACAAQHPVKHPVDDYTGPDIILLHQTPVRVDPTRVEVKETVVMQLGKSSSMLDRSPCGTGSMALATKLWHYGVMDEGQVLRTQSIVGSRFETELREIGKAVGNVDKTLVCRVSGTAHIYSFNKILLQPDDPFQSGFAVSDIWS